LRYERGKERGAWKISAPPLLKLMMRFLNLEAPPLISKQMEVAWKPASGVWGFSLKFRD
jgi:hypothetical protein